MAGPVWFMPWLAKIAPEKTGFKKLLGATQELRNEFRMFIQKRKETYSNQVLNDFLDFYLKEIEETNDKESSFYGDDGGEFFHTFCVGNCNH